jgi:adenylate kinase
VGVLDEILEERQWSVDAALEISLPEDVIVGRLLRRAELEGRVDDTEPVIRERMAIYHEQTAPITDVYASRGALVVVDGLGTVEEVSARIHAALEGKVA